MTLEVAFAGIVFAICALLLKNFGWRGAPVFAVLASLFILSHLGDYFSSLSGISAYFSTVGDGGEVILRVVGISYIFGISSEVCRELGEGGIASALVLVGRFEIIAVILPFINEIFSLALSLVGN